MEKRREVFENNEDLFESCKNKETPSKLLGKKAKKSESSGKQINILELKVSTKKTKISEEEEVIETENQIIVTENKSISATINPLKDPIEVLSKYRIPREFYMTDGVDLAQKLIGKIIVRKVDDTYIKCRIVETEAYCGPHDKGAHCYNNKKTERTKYFWNTGGCLYVYMIHNSNCLNIVANDPDKPEAILIRAIEPLQGIDKIKQLRGDKNPSTEPKKCINLTNGPGKVGSSLSIDRSHNAVDMVTSEEIFLIDDPEYTFTMERSVRININYAQEYIYKPWRFFIRTISSCRK